MERHERLSRELIRALRGKRSQPWLSRRLGLRSNLVYRWEAGRAWPSARQCFRACRVAGMDVGKRIRALFPEIAEVRALDLESPAGVSVLLKGLAGPLDIVELGKRIGRSRFVVSRWLSGKTEIRLPDLLYFAEITTLRLLDFLAALLDPSLLPSAAREWGRLQAARAAAYESPWSHAVLRALELEAYAAEGAGAEGWIARRLGIPLDEEARSLSLLARGGQIRKIKGRWRVQQSDVVDTGVDVQRRRALRAFWSRVAVERLEQGASGVHAFNIFTVAERDLPAVRALHLEFFNRLRALANESAPSERVVLYSTQLLPLDAGPSL